MKIKLFENFESDYYSISQDEFFDTMRSQNLIPLRKEFLNKLQKEFKFVQMPEGVNTYIIDYKKNLQSKKSFRLHIHITEDEWFYVWVRIYDGLSAIEKYYKADQFDGLEKLIQDKVFQ